MIFRDLKNYFKKTDAALQLLIASMFGILFLITNYLKISRIYFIIILTSTVIYYLYHTELKIIINVESSQIPFAVFCISFVGMNLIAQFRNQYIMNSNIIILLLFYPFWGIIQQIVFQQIVTENIYLLTRNNDITIILSSFIFGMIHCFDLYLCIGTFFLGLIWSQQYLKYKNVIILGVMHGWIGAFFYFLVLNKDPLQDLM